MPITTPVSKVEIYNGDKKHFTNVLKHLFTPAIEKAGFEVVCPKSVGSDLIHADIIENLSVSELVLCDMSILNPNVFFELGIRCALNQPAVLVIDEKTEQIPFDTGIINYHSYNSAPLWNKDEEIDHLATHLKESYKKSENYNALWKYFGIKQSGSFSPENATLEDKVDYLIQRMSDDKLVFEYQESAFSNLTSTEKEVLFLVTQGNTNRDIASNLSLAEGTVRNYVSSILSKLGVNNRAEATAYAIESGLQTHISENI